MFETIFVVDVPVGPGLYHYTGIEPMYNQITANIVGGGCSLHMRNPKKDNCHPQATTCLEGGNWRGQFLRSHGESFASRSPKDSERNAVPI